MSRRGNGVAEPASAEEEVVVVATRDAAGDVEAGIACHSMAAAGTAPGMFVATAAAANGSAPPLVHKLPSSRLGAAVINFTPSWFTVIMGVGIVANLLMTAPFQFHGMFEIGVAVWALDVFLFLIFCAFTAARYLTYPWIFAMMLRHSAQSLFVGAHFFLLLRDFALCSVRAAPNTQKTHQHQHTQKTKGTFPMGLATLINGLVTITLHYNLPPWLITLAWALWWLDAALSILSAFALPSLVFLAHKVTLEKFTGAW